MRISDWSSDVCSSDLFHARPEHRLTPARKFGLDPEQVLSIDVGRYRRDPPDGERHRVAGKASRSETALLAGTQIVDVLFLDVERDAVAPHRRDFEQHIALFDRRSEARRVGKEGVSTCGSRGSPEHY